MSRSLALSIWVLLISEMQLLNGAQFLKATSWATPTGGSAAFLAVIVPLIAELGHCHCGLEFYLRICGICSPGIIINLDPFFGVVPLWSITRVIQQI